MRRLLLFVSLATLVGSASAQTTIAKLNTSTVWDKAAFNNDTDIIRFKDRWYVACVESPEQTSHDRRVRILRSKDAGNWEPVTTITSPTDGRGLYDTKLGIDAGGKLTLVCHGVVARPDLPEPLPRFGGTLKSMIWTTTDGITWSDANVFGPQDYPFGRIVVHDGTEYSYSHGTICGSMSHVIIHQRKKGAEFKQLWAKNFDFFPESAALHFEGKTAHCIMQRGSPEGSSITIQSYYGTASAPFDKWEWKEMDRKLQSPIFLRLPDNHVLLVARVLEDKPRTVLFELAPVTGKLTEVHELQAKGVGGLAHHDGEIWISHAGNENGKVVTQVTRLKLK